MFFSIVPLFHYSWRNYTLIHDIFSLCHRLRIGLKGQNPFHSIVLYCIMVNVLTIFNVNVLLCAFYQLNLTICMYTKLMLGDPGRFAVSGFGYLQ